MDKMTNEVRKPREFWVAEDGDNFICQPTKPEKEVFETLDVIHCKEILPGDDSIRLEIPVGPVPNPCPRIPVAGWKDDSIRVSREDWDKLKIKCAVETEDSWELMERIERESKGE